MARDSAQKSQGTNRSKSLKEKTTEFILKQPEFKDELSLLAVEIRKQSLIGENEATIAQHFEMLLYSFLKEQFGIKFLPIKEQRVDTLRHTAKGRMDSRLGALIIEYKHHTKLKSLADQDKATTQITEYMRTVGGQLEQQVIGLVTDGTKARFVILDEAGNISNDSYSELSADHLERLIRNILLLEKTALTPENLVRDFCAPDGVGKQLSIALFDALKNHITGRSQMLFNEWKALFKLAHDDVSKQKAIQERREALADALDISIEPNDNETEYMALYAIQTAYAIIVKVIAYKVIAAVRAQTTIMSFAELARSNSSTIRTHLSRLEEGAVFRDMGFGNLLEGDFFAWYCTDRQWNEKIASRVQSVFKILTQYEDHKMFSENIKAQDLFKDLYMHSIPDKVRHSLGEFYTPPWLADNLINHALELADKPDWKGLDPCCGSGTFITVLIRRVLSEVEKESREDKLRAVLDRVKGIDLNPLAVLTTRINYFINISHLIEDDDAFEIPIFLGDSSYVPQRVKLGTVTCLQYQISTLKGQINIVLPVSTTTNAEAFSTAMTTIETHIQNQDEEAVTEIVLGILSRVCVGYSTGILCSLSDWLAAQTSFRQLPSF
jgi:type I restriction-modification system DNA methylase subunit